MNETPAHKFISDLDAYIDARIEKGTLHFGRLPRPEREAKAEAIETTCEGLRADLLATLTSLMRDAKRPGI